MHGQQNIKLENCLSTVNLHYKMPTCETKTQNENDETCKTRSRMCVCVCVCVRASVCVCVCGDICLLALVRHWLSAIKFCHTKPRNKSRISLRQEQRLYLGRCCWLTPRTPSVGRPSPTNTAIRAAIHDRCHWPMSTLTPLTTLMHIRGST